MRHFCRIFMMAPSQKTIAVKTFNRERNYISRKAIFVMKILSPHPHFIIGLSKSKVISSHCEINEADFLKVLLCPEVYNQLQTHFEKEQKWKSLDKAYVNFTHFVPIRDDSDDFAFTKDGFFAGWQKHMAYFLVKKLPACDLVIPMAYRFHTASSDIIDPDCMSCIIISVKNHSGNEMIELPFLSRECVEGGSEQTSVKLVEDVTIRLALHKLKFINSKGTPRSGDVSDNAWIQTTKDKPFIAFAMSMGDTKRKSDLFVGEKTVIPCICIL
jgi:hypothetical protein